MRRTILIVMLTGAMAAVAAGQRVKRRAYREVADRDIDRAIGAAQRFLWKQQENNGLWHHHHIRPGLPRGGPTAIALFALLDSGVKPTDERIKKGLDALVDVKTQNLYVIATRAMALSQAVAQGREDYRAPLVRDLAWLTKNAARSGAAWGYGGPQRTGDNSCSQFALLALWEADRAGLDIDVNLLRAVEQTWISRQKEDGGWTYPGEPAAARKSDSTLSMTSAGLASLFVCQDVLSLASGPYRHQRAVDRGWAFLADGLTEAYIQDGYLAFCVQRVGIASGHKFIDEFDWFAAGAETLCEPNPFGRRYRGKWGPVVRASFELLFLARGRIPLVFNKLDFGGGELWNFHSRDVARFSEYMRRAFERRMRWQVVDVRDDVRLLLDAPILLVSSPRRPELTDEQWAKLREYTLRGGTLLMISTNQSKAFLDAAKEKLGALYAEQRKLARQHYDLQPMPGEHPVYSAHKPVERAAAMAPMWGVSDGTRLLAVICRRDLPAAWQRRMTTTRQVDFDLGANFFFYATGGNSLPRHLRPVFADTGGEIRHRVRVAWLRHGGNWYTQPYALDYLSQKLTAENRVAIDVRVGAEISPGGLAGADLAWMTGTGEFELGDKQVEALRDYLARGGTLFINAVGGSRAFQRPVRGLLRKLFPEATEGAEAAPEDSPLLTGKCGEFRGPRIAGLERTKAFRLAVPEPPPPLQVCQVSGQTAIVLAANGIHDTLDGHTAHDARSYMPQSARNLAANVVLYALSRRPADRRVTDWPTTVPTTSPAD